MAKKKEVETVRFWKGDLPPIVWDGENDRMLCDMSDEGHITLTDRRAIQILREIGYIEVPLDAVRPPDIRVPIQPEKMDDIQPKSAGLTEKGAAILEESSEDEHGPVVPVPSKRNKKSTKKTVAKKPLDKSRKIKRRK